MRGCCKCRCLYPSSFVVCGSVWNSVEFFDSKEYFSLKMDSVGLARLKSRLLSYASSSVFGQSSFFMIQVLQNVHAFIFVYRTKLFILPHQLHQLHYYCSEWVAYLYSSQLCSLLWMCSLYHISVFISDRYTRKFRKIRQQHVWHEIVSWDCRFKHIISTCRLCHGTVQLWVDTISMSD